MRGVVGRLGLGGRTLDAERGEEGDEGREMRDIEGDPERLNLCADDVDESGVDALRGARGFSPGEDGRCIFCSSLLPWGVTDVVGRSDDFFLSGDSCLSSESKFVIPETD